MESKSCLNRRKTENPQAEPGTNISEDRARERGSKPAVRDTGRAILVVPGTSTAVEVRHLSAGVHSSSVKPYSPQEREAGGQLSL